MVKFPRMAATRPQITRKFVNSKQPDASASPYSHAYSACAHAAQEASLSDPHIASKSSTRFGMAHSRDRASSAFFLTPILIAVTHALDSTKNADFRGAGVPPAIFPISLQHKYAGKTPAQQFHTLTRPLPPAARRPPRDPGTFRA